LEGRDIMTFMKLLSLALIALTALAQETPTERDAAHDVLGKMSDLEHSLDVPTIVERLMASNPVRDQVAARAKELMDKELLAMSDEITKHPEIGFEEYKSIEKLIGYLKLHNFEVTMGAGGLKTAFVARYKGHQGAPNLGVILEYDALRGTTRAFHGDQHSAQGPVGIAAAVAIAEIMDRNHLPGSLTVFGTPGEEMMPPNAKTVMHEAGVFNGMDILVRSHSSSVTSRPAPGFGTCCLNIDGVKYIFSGAPSHQMTPWAGRNALEAVIHLFNNIDAVRSSIRPEARIQGVITEGGAAPNVVPDRAVADFYIRYPDEVYLEQVKEFVDNAARAAALATGTKVKIDNYGQDRDGISVGALAEVAFGYMKKYGATKIAEAPGKPQGYEETGSVSSVIPGIGFSAATSNWPNHTYEMEADATTDVGHHGFTVDAQAMAALLYDFLTRPEYRAQVKKEFDGTKTYFEEYKASLRKVYVRPNVPDPK
jgi:amidohydrolase